MSDLRFCPKCGTNIKTGERFCGNCGFDTETVIDFDKANLSHQQSKLVGSPDHPQFAGADQIQAKTAPNQGQKSSKMPKIIITVVLA